MKSFEERENAIALRKSGMVFTEIASELGVSATWVRNVCLQEGVTCKNRHHKRTEEIKAYKAAGHTNRETAEHYGITLKAATQICKGIGPIEKRSGHNQHEQKDPKEYIESFLNNRFTYVGGYTNSNGKVTIRCNQCGEVFERSVSTIRNHKTTTCEKCKTIKLEEEQNARLKEKEKARILKEKEKENARILKEEELLEKLNERIHQCPVCGKQTVRRVYCCDACRNRAYNSRAEHQRRAKIKQVTIDKGIDVHSLFNRDNGICYLCGCKCEWEDYKTLDNGTIVCGDSYPSIDHVIPLAKGGEHSWGNVRLAHRRCNYLKKDFIPPLVAEFAQL